MRIDSFGPYTEPSGRCFGRLASCHGRGYACLGRREIEQTLDYVGSRHFRGHNRSHRRECSVRRERNHARGRGWARDARSSGDHRCGRRLELNAQRAHHIGAGESLARSRTRHLPPTPRSRPGHAVPLARVALTSLEARWWQAISLRDQARPWADRRFQAHLPGCTAAQAPGELTRMRRVPNEAASYRYGLLARARVSRAPIVARPLPRCDRPMEPKCRYRRHAPGDGSARTP